MKPSILSIVVCVLLAAAAVRSQEQQFANLGDFKLESGETIRGLRVGYRIFGTMNADRSNIVLFLTWAGGTTASLILSRPMQAA